MTERETPRWMQLVSAGLAVAAGCAAFAGCLGGLLKIHVLQAVGAIILGPAIFSHFALEALINGADTFYGRTYVSICIVLALIFPVLAWYAFW